MSQIHNILYLFLINKSKIPKDSAYNAINQSYDAQSYPTIRLEFSHEISNEQQ